MRMAGAASPAQVAARGDRTRLMAMCGDRQPPHLHAHDLDLVFRAPVCGEKVRRVRLVRRIKIALPKVVGLHQVEIAIQDEIALARHGPAPVQVAGTVRDLRIPGKRRSANCRHSESEMPWILTLNRPSGSTAEAVN